MTASSRRPTRGSSDLTIAVRAVAGDQPALVNHAETIGQLQRLAHVVRDDDHGLPHAGLDAPKLFLQLGSRHRIQRAERFVHQQHRRIGRERPRDADALTLPARQLVRPALRVQLRRQPDQLEQLGDPRRDAVRAPRLPAAGPPRCCRRRSCAETARRPESRSRPRAADGSGPSRACPCPRPARDRPAGSSRRFTSFRTVVLPAPLRPTSAITSPLSMLRSKWFRTGALPGRLYETSRNSMAGIARRAHLRTSRSRRIRRLADGTRC